MVNEMIGILAAMAAEPGREMPFRAICALAGLSRKEVACAFEVFGHEGIAAITGSTPLGCVARTELLDGKALGVGAEKYAAAYDAYKKALEGICISDITIENKPL